MSRLCGHVYHLGYQNYSIQRFTHDCSLVFVAAFRAADPSILAQACAQCASNLAVMGQARLPKSMIRESRTLADLFAEDEKFAYATGKGGIAECFSGSFTTADKAMRDRVKAYDRVVAIRMLGCWSSARFLLFKPLDQRPSLNQFVCFDTTFLDQVANQWDCLERFALIARYT